VVEAERLGIVEERQQVASGVDAGLGIGPRRPALE
jgi:hypothetical protein